MKNKVAFFLFLGFFISSAAFADCGPGRGVCPTGGKYASAGAEAGACPIAGRFMEKSHFFLENREALGLTDDQVKVIRDLKMEVKKNSIRDAAEMQIFMLDLDSKLSEDTVDAEAINAMMDKGMTSMLQSGKANVQAYAKLKAVPTKEQMAKFKAIQAKQDEEEGEAEHPHA